MAAVWFQWDAGAGFSRESRGRSSVDDGTGDQDLCEIIYVI